MHTDLQPHFYQAGSYAALPWLDSHGTIHHYTGDIFQRQVLNVSNNLLPQTIRREVAGNDPRISQGQIAINDDIVYGRQYADNKTLLRNAGQVSGQPAITMTSPRMTDSALTVGNRRDPAINAEDTDEICHAKLMRAARMNRIKIIEKLIAGGCYPNGVNAEGKTALMLAIEHGAYGAAKKTISITQ